MSHAAGRGQGWAPEAFFLEFLKNVIQMNCFRKFFTVFVEPISFDTLLRRKSFDTLLRRKSLAVAKAGPKAGPNDNETKNKKGTKAINYLEK